MMGYQIRPFDEPGVRATLMPRRPLLTDTKLPQAKRLRTVVGRVSPKVLAVDSSQHHGDIRPDRSGSNPPRLETLRPIRGTTGHGTVPTTSTVWPLRLSGNLLELVRRGTGPRKTATEKEINQATKGNLHA
jgi:hypothetical protein